MASIRFTRGQGLIALCVVGAGVVGYFAASWLFGLGGSEPPTPEWIEPSDSDSVASRPALRLEITTPETPRTGRDAHLLAIADAAEFRAEALDDPWLGKRVAKSGAALVVEIPRSRRWQLYFQKSVTLDEYARQLEYFKIELGVLEGGTEVTYVSSLVRPTPDKRTDKVADENRLYMSWRRGQLGEADRRLASLAGIEVGDKLVVQFLPAELEAKLADLELAFAKRSAKEIRLTRFAIRSVGAGYEFKVIEQLPLE